MGLLHRKRYMASRVSEARQLHQPPAAIHRREAKQEQQPADAEGQQQQQAPGDAQQGQPPAHGQGAATEQHTVAAAAAVGLEGSEGGTGGAAAAAAAGAGQYEAGPSGAAPEEQAGMECPVCLGTVPAGADIHVFSGCGHAFCKGAMNGGAGMQHGMPLCCYAFMAGGVRAYAHRTPSHLTPPHPPRRLRCQAGAAAGLLRRVPPKSDGQAGGACGGGRQQLRRRSLRS